MVSRRKANRKDPAYQRKQGERKINEKKGRNLSFSLTKHVKAEGQSIKEWSEFGLLEKLLLRLKYLGQYPALTVRQNKWIKEYHKVDYPPDSEFTEPKHVSNVTWAVLHITPKSREVVVGYIENDIFYIVFLDKDHKFWPSSLKHT